jgi:ribonuclease VapC
MIVVDTSAVIAIANNEPEADACIAILTQHDEALISAGTLLEIIVVGARKGISQSVTTVMSNMLYTTIDVTEDLAHYAGDAYRQWGKGFHPAGLNFGDCFAYALAKQRDCPLLFIGNDFTQTDIIVALPSTG